MSEKAVAKIVPLAGGAGAVSVAAAVVMVVLKADDTLKDASSASTRKV